VDAASLSERHAEERLVAMVEHRPDGGEHAPCGRGDGLDLHAGMLREDTPGLPGDAYFTVAAD